MFQPEEFHKNLLKIALRIVKCYQNIIYTCVFVYEVLLEQRAKLSQWVFKNFFWVLFIANARQANYETPQKLTVLLTFTGHSSLNFDSGPTIIFFFLLISPYNSLSQVGRLLTTLDRFACLNGESDLFLYVYTYIGRPPHFRIVYSLNFIQLWFPYLVLSLSVLHAP